MRRLLTLIFLFNLIPAPSQAADNVIIVDDGDSSFSKEGNWQPTNILIPGVAYNSDYLQAGAQTPAAKAAWTMYVNPGVQYRISAVWYAPPGQNLAYSPAAQFKIYAGNTVLASPTVNMRRSSDDLTVDGVTWENLGTFTVNSNPVKVELLGQTDKLVLADAVRIERLDGQPIFSPKITNVMPKPVLTTGGVTVTIEGTDLDPSARFTVGTVAMTNTVFVSATEMKATIPAMPAGEHDVTITNQTGQRHTLPKALRYSDILYMDDTDPGYRMIGRWGRAQATQPNNAYNGIFYQAAPSNFPTRTVWRFALPPGEYFFAARWPSFPAPYNIAYATDVKYQIVDGERVLSTGIVNQQNPPQGLTDGNYLWNGVGIQRITNGDVKIILLSHDTKTVMADAVRIERRTAPHFTTQPSSREVEVGGRAIFAVVATGRQPITYQWVKNNEPIPGATSPAYLTPPVTMADNGAKFMCVATNFFGAQPSSLATLTVTPSSITDPETPQVDLPKTNPAKFSPTPCIVSAGCRSIQISIPGQSCQVRVWNKRGELMHQMSMQSEAQWAIGDAVSGVYAIETDCENTGKSIGKIAIVR